MPYELHITFANFPLCQDPHYFTHSFPNVQHRGAKTNYRISSMRIGSRSFARRCIDKIKFDLVWRCHIALFLVSNLHSLRLCPAHLRPISSCLVISWWSQAPGGGKCHIIARKSSSLCSVVGGRLVNSSWLLRFLFVYPGT